MIYLVYEQIPQDKKGFQSHLFNEEEDIFKGKNKNSKVLNDVFQLILKAKTSYKF